MKASLSLFSVLALLISGGVTARADDQPGDFDYYTLALSWSPTYCATQGRSRPDEPQCAGERPFAFVVHGLWPQYDRGWPSNCRTRERPWVPDDLIRNMLDIMPSKRLIIHQYRKHGVCSGLSPEKYFAASRKAYDTIRIPERFQNVGDYLSVTPQEVEREFLEANPQLKADMISVDCKDRRLRELRICFTRDLQLTSCGVNEAQEKLCSADKLIMPPTRAAAWRNGSDDAEYDEEEDDEENGDDRSRD